MSRAWLTLLLATMIAPASRAQDGQDAARECPDTVVRAVLGSTELGPVVDCAGLSGTINGVSFSSANGCPTFVLVTPPHNVSEHVPGSNTEAIAVGWTSRILVSFECQSSWIFFSNCVHKDTAIVDRRPYWTQRGCRSRGPRP